MMYLVSNNHSSVSQRMNLKHIATISHTLNIGGLVTVSKHKITNIKTILMKLVWVADDMIRGSCHCCQLN